MVGQWPGSISLGRRKVHVSGDSGQSFDKRGLGNDGFQPRLGLSKGAAHADTVIRVALSQKMVGLQTIGPPVCNETEF